MDRSTGPVSGGFASSRAISSSAWVRSVARALALPNPVSRAATSGSGSACATSIDAPDTARGVRSSWEAFATKRR